MKLLRRQFLHLAAGAGALVAFIGTATAQQYPIRPISMIVPFAAGGPQDVIGRVVAQRMGEILGQQVVVENIGGAGGTTGSMRVKNAAPDGYTFVWASVGTHAQSQTLYKRPAYNAVEDFTAVAFVGETPIALTVRKDLPVSNLQEFAAYAKANEAKMSFGSGGAGSAAHLGCVVLNMALKTNMTHVPYRGAAPALQDLHGGRIDFMCEIINTAKPHIESGAVKALAIMTKERSPVLPNLPTAAEQGIKSGSLHLERGLSAERRTVRDRQEAQRRGGEGAGHAGREGAAGSHGRHGRAARAALARIHGAVRAQRDRQMGGTDQGERRADRVSACSGRGAPTATDASLLFSARCRSNCEKLGASKCFPLYPQTGPLLRVISTSG